MDYHSSKAEKTVISGKIRLNNCTFYSPEHVSRVYEAFKVLFAAIDFEFTTDVQKSSRESFY